MRWRGLSAWTMVASLAGCSFTSDRLPSGWKPPAEPHCTVNNAPVADVVGALLFGLLGLAALDTGPCYSGEGAPCDLGGLGAGLVGVATVEAVAAGWGFHQNSRCGAARTTYARWLADTAPTRPTPPPVGSVGTRGQACYPNATCQSGLECVAGRCAPAPLEGREHGVCFPNETCFPGLVCAPDGHCARAPAPEPPASP